VAHYEEPYMGSPKRATYADLDRTPEGDGNVYELIDGVLYCAPPAKYLHTSLQNFLRDSLYRELGIASPQGAPRWRFFTDLELRLGGDAFVPDITAYQAPVPAPGPDGYMTTPPPWVCEVLSPSNFRYDWSRKVPAYFRHGVETIWIIEPRDRTLHVLTPDGVRASFTGLNDTPVHPPPFAVALDLAALWRELPSSD
jgi:Uma2 family endonuclease